MKQIRNVLLGINNTAADNNFDIFLVILVTNVDFYTLCIRDCPFKKILTKCITKYIWELKYLKLPIMHRGTILKYPSSSKYPARKTYIMLISTYDGIRAKAGNLWYTSEIVKKLIQTKSHNNNSHN